MSSLLSILVLGFVLGVRHATDADHVIAVSAIASRERSVRKAMLVGISWGLGHAATVFLAGGAIVLFGIVVPPRLGLGMEFSVALMLIALGALNFSGTFQRRKRSTSTHAHAASSFVLRSAGVGVVHGLAGSAAVALLVLASIRDAGAVLAYLLVFGAGTIVGMVALTSAFAVPLAYASHHFERAQRAITRAAGALSVAFGLGLAYRIGFVDGLFLP